MAYEWRDQRRPVMDPYTHERALTDTDIVRHAARIQAAQFDETFPPVKRVDWQAVAGNTVMVLSCLIMLGLFSVILAAIAVGIG